MLRIFCASLLVVVACSAIAVAAPPLDATTDQSVHIRDRIVARMSDVDDIGLLIVWNGGRQPLSVISSCEWREGVHGTTTVTLNERHLNKGVNYLLFVLYNQRFKGLWGGKYSYNFSLEKNFQKIWSKSENVGNNTPRIEYAKPFRIYVDSDGRTSITDRGIPKGDMDELQKLVDTLEKTLVAKAPEKTLQAMKLVEALLSDY
jgi:hypothetical protein